MTTPLSERLGLQPRELVAIVGAGGKTTIMGILAEELSSVGASVILTTTTKMGADQVTEPVCWSSDPHAVEEMLVRGVPLSVLSGEAGGKVTGLQPDAVDRLFDATAADYVIVEADGARSMSIKAPAAHEPVIPRLSTTVIVVMGADALVCPLGTVAHRVDRISALTGLSGEDVPTPDAAAQILLHPNGGLKDIPEGARVEMAISKVTSENETSARALASILGKSPRVDRSVLVWSFSVTR
ncbi:MAG: selenium cofactor biosynthesis protein YqeC [Actinomycetia bacterium]|nr:selenium cofactor biosynthesis protein YqeC [Actinomycetes bacterium]